MAAPDATREGERSAVLHVDGDAEFLERAAAALGEAFDVTTATSAAAGLDRLAEGGIDCLVTEHDLPDGEAFEFLDAVRADHPSLPVVVCTGEDGEVASRALQRGAADYVPKGEGVERLAEGVRAAVEDARERHRLRRRAAVFEATPAAVVVGVAWEGEYPVTDVNEGFEETFGRGAAGVVGESVFEVLEFEGRERTLVDRCLSGGDHVRAEVERETGGGTRCFVLDAMPPGDEQGGVWSLAYLDITERKARERELETLREQTEFALDAADSLIWTVDPDTLEIASCSGPTESMFGVVPGDGDDVTDFLDRAAHPEDRDAIRQGWGGLLEGDASQATVQFRTHPDRGEVRWIEAEARRRTAGQGTRVIGLSTDVTEQKRREQRLRRQNERLDDFASIVSHDLRNPLDVASGRLELAREECDSDHLDAVGDAHDRMEELIEDLLTLARQGEEVTDLTAVDLTTLADRCWHTVRTRDATLVTSGECTLRADPTRLQELLENLVRNAVEHGGDDVTVRVGPLDDAEGFYVADDGPGIPDDEREAVFESGYSTAEDGTGFGLAIVEEIADAHGWRVAVTESEEGGARFEVTGVETV